MAVQAPKPGALDFEPQTQSPLFSKIPGEIRNLIYLFALCEYEDPNDAYSADTCYKRPGYFARRRIDTSLLRTCQKVHEEAWFVPWTSLEHILFFTSASRRPERYTTQEQLAKTLAKIHSMHGEEATVITHVRLFPQLYLLENGKNLAELLAIPHFNPTYFTITLRHTDWWLWENDEPLRIASGFVNSCKFPNSVTEIRLELESIERRRPQIQDIAAQMESKWVFRRRDDKALVAVQGSENEVMRWEGSSTWNNQRWLRDETKPDTLLYYMQTVRFRVDPDSDLEARPHTSPELRVMGYKKQHHAHASTRADELADRGIGPGFSADEVWELLDKYRRRCQCALWKRLCCGTGLGARWARVGSQSPYCQNCLVRCLEVLLMILFVGTC